MCFDSFCDSLVPGFYVINHCVFCGVICGVSGLLFVYCSISVDCICIIFEEFLVAIPAKHIQSRQRCKL